MPTVPLEPTHIVLISPHADRLIEKGFLGIAKVQYVAFQGNEPCKENRPNVLCSKWDETRAANDNGNVEFFNGLPDNCSIRTVTTTACQELLFGRAFFERYGLPNDLIETILKNTFKLGVGRIHPKHHLAKAIAVSLITMSKKGSTVKLLRRLMESIEMEQVQMSDKLEEAVDKYLSDLTSNGIELCNDTRDGLVEICQSLTALLGEEPCYKDDKGYWRLFTSTNEHVENNDLSISLKDGYNTFKNIPDLTPVFDLQCAMWFCKDIFGYNPDNVHFFPHKKSILPSITTVVSVAVVCVGIWWNSR